HTIGGVLGAGGIILECKGTGGRVVNAGRVPKERSIAIGRIAVTFGVVKQSERSTSSVLGASGVAQKRPCAGRSIFNSLKRAWVSCVGAERSSPDGRIELAIRVAPERKEANSRVECTSAKARKC